MLETNWEPTIATLKNPVKRRLSIESTTVRGHVLLVKYIFIKKILTQQRICCPSLGDLCSYCINEFSPPALYQAPSFRVSILGSIWPQGYQPMTRVPEAYVCQQASHHRDTEWKLITHHCAEPSVNSTKYWPV